MDDILAIDSVPVIFITAYPERLLTGDLSGGWQGAASRAAQARGEQNTARLTELRDRLQTIATTLEGGGTNMTPLRQAIVDIAYGTTASYGALAKAIGSSPRAIGQACARNPFPIIVPCHRILGAGGALGAYSAGEGPITKSRLLDHERPQGGLL